MRPLVSRNFNSDDMALPITGEATPPAMASLLAEADAWLVDTAVAPYCGCAHVFDGLTATIYEARHLAAVIAPGAVHARAALSRCFTTTTGSIGKFHEMWSSDGGSTGNDVIRVPWHLNAAAGYVPEPAFKLGLSSIAVSGGSIVDAPTTPMDRQLELATLAVPYVEPLYVSIAAGFSLCITDQAADLETL
jgi:hypothetical protein